MEEHNDEPSSPEKQAKLVQNPEETYQREIDILQKLFPQKDKVNYENFWFKCVNIAKSLSMKINFNWNSTKKTVFIVFKVILAEVLNHNHGDTMTTIQQLLNEKFSNKIPASHLSPPSNLPIFPSPLFPGHKTVSPMAMSGTGV